MKSVVYPFALSVFLLTAVPASAQSEAALISVHEGSALLDPSSTPTAASAAPITTRLSAFTFSEPAAEEGFATVRIADEAGEAVYRGMIPVAAGQRSLDLSAVRVPAAGRYSVRIIYPGGVLVQDLETPYTVAGAAGKNDVAAGW